MSLNTRKKIFCEEYIIDLNATQAAIRAKYSKKTARQIGQRLLTNVDIQEYIQKLMKKREERTEITQDRVLEELALIGFSDLAELLEIEEGGLIVAKKFDDIPKGKTRTLKAIKEDRIIRETPDGKQMVVHDKIKYEIWDKPKALEMMGRHLGMFVDNLKHTGEVKLKHELSMKNLKESLKDFDENGSDTE